MKEQDMAKLIAQTDFKPYAYYDKHLDKIVFYGKNCGVISERKNKVFTLLKNAQGKHEYVGFTIKGIRHMLKEVGFTSTDSLTLSEFLSEIVEICNDETMRMIQKKFSKNMSQPIENFQEAA